MKPEQMTVKQLREELNKYGVNMKGAKREDLVLYLNSKIKTGAQKIFP